jgi:uracil-DNA glycosylase
MTLSQAERIARLEQEIRACRLCVEEPEGAPLPHEPNPIIHLSVTARLCVAGQAAGTLAHASSKPFNDPSGVRLRDWMGIAPEVFYDTDRLAIVPMGLCFPGLDARGYDLPPRRECAPRWRAQIFDVMPQIEMVLAVGQYAQAWHLGRLKKKTLTETVVAWRHILEATDKPKVLPLPHPSWRNNAWIKRNPWFAEELLPVLRAEVARLTG